MSSKIAVLSVEVANKIAAGEVVERPASVVKELVENALDAGCRRVTVDVAEAGRRLIRVTDDGEGMPPADAGLAFLRHATSKIRSEADLFAIRTMGFRGEALPSIAAVSKVRLVTVAAGASSGTELRIEGGAITSEREAAAAPGTMVEVAELFYNTPARKKFLKSPATELGHICRVVQRQALAFPAIHFRLLHNGASVSDYPAVGSLRERVQQVYGEALVKASITVEGEATGLRLEGLCCRPLETTTARTPQDIFVNLRWVKSQAIVHAVYEGYGTFLAKGRHPRFVLALTVDPRHVDVNVHPTKREVRFSDQERVHEFVRTRVKAVVGHEPVPARGARSAIGVGGTAPAAETGTRIPGGFHAATPTGSESLFAPAALVTEAAQPYLPSVRQDVRPLGQIAERYILGYVGEELQIVDQHTAHERVLFERLCAQFESGPIPSQPSLFAQTVELAADAGEWVRSHLADLERVGFEIEEFGRGAFRIRALPALLGPADPAALLAALVEDWEDRDSTPSVQARYHAVLASMACHSAVRSGRKLEIPEMRRLLEDWHDAGRPATCPHGRRIAMRLTIEELDRIFGREGWV